MRNKEEKLRCREESRVLRPKDALASVQIILRRDCVSINDCVTDPEPGGAGRVTITRSILSAQWTHRFSGSSFVSWWSRVSLAALRTTAERDLIKTREHPHPDQSKNSYFKDNNNQREKQCPGLGLGAATSSFIFTSLPRTLCSFANCFHTF